MEISLKQETLEYYAKIMETELAREETAETIVPDTLPDVVSVADADASVWLRSKEVTEGRLTINALVSGTVLYRGGDGETLCRMPVQLPVTLRWDAEGLGRDSLCTVSLSLAGFEARIINSRKLLLRGEVLASVRCFALTQAALTVGAESEALELKEETIRFPHLAAVGERGFTVTGELSLGGSKPRLGELLKSRVRLVTEEVTAAGPRLAARCRAVAELVYRAAESGELCSAELALPFSQLWDTGLSTEPEAAAAELQLTGVRLEPAEGEEGTLINAELGVAAVFFAWQTTEPRCVTDAYCLRHELELTPRELRLYRSEPGRVEEDAVTELLECAEPVKNVLSVAARLGKADGEGRRELRVRVLCETGEGRLTTLTDTAALSLTAPAAALWTGEATARPVSGGLELRVPLCRLSREEECLLLTTPEKLELNEEETKDFYTPSVTALRADGKRCLWELAKGFNTTVAAIREANSGLSADPPEADTLLLIPRAR